MFRMSENTKIVLGSKTKRMSRAEALEKRQKVYQYIIENPDKATNRVELAKIAGYDMSNSLSESYKAGYAFLTNMIVGGHIKEVIDRYNIGKYLYYITTKETVECLSSTKTTKQEPIIKNEDDYLKASVREFQKAEKQAEEAKKDEPKYNIRFYVSEVGRCGENVDIELDDLTEAEIFEKVKAAIKLV